MTHIKTHTIERQAKQANNDYLNAQARMIKLNNLCNYFKSVEGKIEINKAVDIARKHLGGKGKAIVKPWYESASFYIEFEERLERDDLTNRDHIFPFDKELKEELGWDAYIHATDGQILIYNRTNLNYNE